MAKTYVADQDRDNLSKALRAEFPPGEVRQRAGRGGMKLDYLGIDSTINRILDVSEQFGVDAQFDIVQMECRPTPNGSGYFSCIHGRLTIAGKTWAGTGCAIAPDPDDSIKTAQAEAIKKAGHGFGIGLYLWDADKRAEIGEARKLIDGDLKALQAAVKKLAKDNGIEGREALCEAYGLDAEDLFDAEKLKGVLRDNGRL